MGERGRWRSSKVSSNVRRSTLHRRCRRCSEGSHQILQTDVPRKKLPAIYRHPSRHPSFPAFRIPELDVSVCVPRPVQETYPPPLPKHSGGITGAFSPSIGGVLASCHCLHPRCVLL